MILGFEERVSKAGNSYGILHLEDETSDVSFHVSPYLYAKHKDSFKIGNVISLKMNRHKQSEHDDFYRSTIVAIKTLFVSPEKEMKSDKGNGRMGKAKKPVSHFNAGVVF